MESEELMWLFQEFLPLMLYGPIHSVSANDFRMSSLFFMVLRFSPLEDVVIAEDGEDNVVEGQRGEESRGLCVEVKGVFS